MSTHLFTYGSLMFAPVWERVIGAHRRSVPACLFGYARFTVRGEPYPGIIPDPGAQVHGRVYLDLDLESLAALDHFEGAEYARTEVAVILADGATCSAQTYVYLYPDKLSDSDWEPERFDWSAFLGMPGSYSAD